MKKIGAVLFFALFPMLFSFHGIFLLLIPAINLHAWPVPDTGQTKCYNNTAEIPCLAPGEAFYGQE